MKRTNAALLKDIRELKKKLDSLQSKFDIAVDCLKEIEKENYCQECGQFANSRSALEKIIGKDEKQKLVTYK